MFVAKRNQNSVQVEEKLKCHLGVISSASHAENKTRVTNGG